jgi:hypothetical protein
MTGLGTIPDWLVALFTGLSAFFLWRSTWSKIPVVELERVWTNEGPHEVNITIRNPSADHVAVISELYAEPRDLWDLRSSGQPVADKRIDPKSSATFHCTIDGGQRVPPTSTSMPTIHAVILCNRRKHKIKMTF